MKNFEINSKKYILAGFFIVVILSLLSSQQLVTANEREPYENKVLGVQFDNEQGYIIREQEILSDVLGFTISEVSDQLHDLPKLQISWRHEETEDLFTQLVERDANRYPDLVTKVQIVKVDGLQGAALYPMPGVELNTLIYVISNERVYEIRYFGKINEELNHLLNKINFVEPKEEFKKDNYVLEEDSIFIDPSEVPQTNESSSEKEPNQNSLPPNRSLNIGADDTNFVVNQYSDLESPRSLNTYTPVSGCIEDGGYVQTQWNNWANSPNNTGKSWAGLSFWGQGAHGGCNSGGSYNDHYALDHWLNRWNAIYPHRSGQVVFAGWMGGGWSTLGRTVIVKYSNNFYGVMSHLEYIPWHARSGNWVNTSTVIGYAGASGNYTNNYWSSVHLHQSIQKGGTVQQNPGGIYGGQSARPASIKYSGGQYNWWDMSSGKEMNHKP